MARKIQNADVKGTADVATPSLLINDDKIYVTADAINKTLKQAIIDADIGGGGGGGASQAAAFRYVVASGTGGGSSTGGDAIDTRTLNTHTEVGTSFSSLAANQMTIAAGSYIVIGFNTGFEVNHHKCFLYNVTDTSYDVIGSVTRGRTTDSHNTDSHFYAVITIVAGKVFELRAQTETAGATTGYGTRRGAFGNSEVFCQVLWIKTA